MIKFFNKFAVKTECIYFELNANIIYLKVWKKGIYTVTSAKIWKQLFRSRSGSLRPTKRGWRTSVNQEWIIENKLIRPAYYNEFFANALLSGKIW